MTLMQTLSAHPTNERKGLEELVRGVGLTIEASIATHQRLFAGETTVALIASVAETIVKSMRQGGKLPLFGNGGSAADAQHIAAAGLAWSEVLYQLPRCR